MAITLLQKNSFMFDERAAMNKFNISNRLGIDCVLECVDKKILLTDKLQHHVLFLKGRTGSGKSSCMPSRIFKHLDLTKDEKPKVLVNVVEPRVLLAKSISQDNCDVEPYLKFGINTGYSTGAGKTEIKGPSKLVYMTTDLFRMKLTSGGNLGDIVIIDECHILDRPTITTLYEIKKYLYSNEIPITKKPLFIFASATLNLDLMVHYFFDKCEITEKSMFKFSIDDIYRDGLMINHIAGQRNFDVKEEYITSEQEALFKNNEREFVKYIMTEGIEKCINSKEKWKGLPARDILIFSYGMGFNKLFEDSESDGKDAKFKKDSRHKMKGGDLDEIEHNLDIISNELDKYLKEEEKVPDLLMAIEDAEDDDVEDVDEDLKDDDEDVEDDDDLKDEDDDDLKDVDDVEDDDLKDEDNEDLKDVEDDLKDDDLKDDLEDSTDSDKKQYNLTGADIKSLCKYPVFISTMKYDDTEQAKQWRQDNQGKFRVLILPYGSTCKGFASKLLETAYDPDPDSQQFEIKIYISTDAIETGKTVNTWYQVYDTGLRLSNIKNPLLYNPKQRQGLIRHPITQSASIQRCGRVGRKCPGVSVRVFTRETWNKMIPDQPPENVYLVSTAGLNLECRESNPNPNIADPVHYNDYIQPNSFDTNLMTGRDLACSGYTTPWGEFINDIREYKEPAASWVLKAEELYYINNMDLFKTLVLCRNSRSGISDLISTASFEKKLIPDNMEDVDNAVVMAIYEARQEYVKFLIGKSKIFKSIK